ncbi:MAG: transposase [Myxococcaceae bacterium]|nr:transposase [Myxococcaceae bacterium]
MAAEGFEVALVKPRHTRRFAEEGLQRTKTGAIDALGIASFAAQKKPEPSRLVAVLGAPADFDDERALAAYVGVVPALRHSGKNNEGHASLSNVGNVELRTAIYTPTLTAVKRNTWSCRFYERPISKGKPREVALLAAMRRLLGAGDSVAKNQKPFVPILSEARA